MTDGIGHFTYITDVLTDGIGLLKGSTDSLTDGISVVTDGARQVGITQYDRGTAAISTECGPVVSAECETAARLQ